MSDLKDYHNYNIEELPKESKFKRLRNKNSYIDTFLERRKQAADFALEKRNCSGYKYSKPFYYINEGKIISNKYKQQKYKQNLNEDKKQFYKEYNTLKKNLTRKNNPINNNILIEKENNKYYLSQDLPKNLNYYNIGYYKHKNNDNNNIYNYFENSNQFKHDFENQEINEKYNNTKLHAINLSKNNKKKNNKNISSKNHISKTFEKNFKNEKTNYYTDKRINKNNNELSSSLDNKKNKDNYIIKNQYEYIINNNKYKSIKNVNTNPNYNSNVDLIMKEEIQKKIKLNPDNNIYYKGSDNHKYYESNSNKIGNYKTYKNYDDNQNKLESRNFSEPKNLERNKHIYKIKCTKNNVGSENIKKTIKNNQINEISPIRTYARYDYEDNNDDFQGIEKIYESQSLNGISINNSNPNFKYNIKLKNNYNKSNKSSLNSLENKENGTKAKSALLNIHSSEIIKNTPNTKTVSIVYKSQNNNLNKNSQTIKELGKKNKNEIVEIKNDNKQLNNINNINNINNNLIIKEEIDNKNINDYKEVNYAINSINEKNIKNDNKNEYKLKYNNDNIINNNNMNTQKNESNMKINIIQLSNDKNNENNIENNIIENNIFIKKINKSGRNKNNNFLNDESNIEIKEDKRNKEYQKIVDQEENYDNIKEKYESFLRQKDEKEPNLQSKIMNSMLTSKEDTNNSINLIKNIKEKIKLLKNNNKNNIKQNINYINEIDDYFIKIKQKEEKNNLVLNEYYQNLLKKESNEKKVKNDNNEIEKKNDNKKIVIKKSNRLQNMMKNIINNQKYRYYGPKNNNIVSIKTISSKNYFPRKENEDIKELTLKNNFNNIKFSKYNNAPDINLIVDEDNINNIKLIDEDEYSKLKKKNNKSLRNTNIMIERIKESNPKIGSYRDRFDLFGFDYFGKNNLNFNNENNKNYFSPRIIYLDSNHKIMPANEII